MIGFLVLSVLIGAFQVQAVPIQTPFVWFDNFEEDTGLYDMVDTVVVTTTGHLALAHSPAIPDQYVTSGLATSNIINPLVATVPYIQPPLTIGAFTHIAASQGDFLYLTDGDTLMGGSQFFSYQLSSGQLSQVHSFPSLSLKSLAAGVDGLIYIGVSDHLYAYNPNNGNLDDLGTPIPTSEIYALAASPSGLIYGIAGRHLFSYSPGLSSFSDLGIFGTSQLDEGTALTATDTGKVYGGYTSNTEGRLFIYDPISGLIIDKGQVLGQQKILTLVTGLDGRIYGGTNTYSGSVGRFFAYDPASDGFVDLAGYYGGVYALIQGADNLLYGATRRDGNGAYLFIYDPVRNFIRETGRVKTGDGHVSALAWASDGRVYGTQTNPVWHSTPGDYLYSLVVYDPAKGAFVSWDKVTFAYTAPSGTTVRIDVLDDQNNVLLSGVSSGDSLTSIDPSIYPVIQLRANLGGNGFATPLLDSWAVNMTISGDFYTLSGKVADVNDNRFAGVMLSAGAGWTTVTDDNGSYTFIGLRSGEYTVIPTLAGYAFWPPTRTVTLPPDAVGQNFVVLAEPVSITLPMSDTVILPANLTYTDTQGLTTTIEFPADAITQTFLSKFFVGVADQSITLVLTPTLARGGIGLAFAGHAFNLNAYQGGKSIPTLSLSKPATVTIYYSDADVRVVSEKSELALWWWTDSGWRDAASTCDPPSAYNRDLNNRVLSVPICHLSLFSLLGPTHQTYLPLILRSQ